jgi:hypothetical protein
MSQVIPLQKTPKIKLSPKPSNRKKGLKYKQVCPREWLTPSEAKDYETKPERSKMTQAAISIHAK